MTAISTRSRRRRPCKPDADHVRMAGASDQDAGRVAQRPGAKDAPEFVGGDHVAEVQRHRPESGADDGCEERARDESQHVKHAVELAPPAGQAAQDQGRDHERQRVPHRLAEDGPERCRVIPEPEVADHNARPEPSAIQEQHGKSKSRRRPQGRHRTVEIGKLEADPSRQVIADGNKRNGTPVEHDTAVPGPAQRREPSGYPVGPVSPRSKRCHYALPRAESKPAGPATATNLAIRGLRRSSSLRTSLVQERLVEEANDAALVLGRCERPLPFRCGGGRRRSSLAPWRDSSASGGR